MSARTKEQTRQLMLETGKELLEEHGVPEEIPIKLSDVLARLKLTTGAAYHIWDSQDAYRRDLTLYVNESMASPTESNMHQLIDECKAEDFSATVRATAKRYLQSYMDGDVFTRLYYWTIKNPSPEVTKAAIAAYKSNSSFIELCYELIGSCGRRIVEATNRDEVGATTLALLDGFSLRVHLNPDEDRQGTLTAFGNAVADYLGAVTETA